MSGGVGGDDGSIGSPIDDSPNDDSPAWCVGLMNANKMRSERQKNTHTHTHTKMFQSWIDSCSKSKHSPQIQKNFWLNKLKQTHHSENQNQKLWPIFISFES